MGWIENYRRRGSAPDSQAQQNEQIQFTEAARERWRLLGKELQADVAEFNARNSQASFTAESGSLYRVRNSASGLELVLRADFDDCVVRYDYAAINNQSAGAPDGGMLSIRKSPRGTVEFYTADERLSSEETRQVLLEPVLFPPQMAA